MWCHLFNAIIVSAGKHYKGKRFWPMLQWKFWLKKAMMEVVYSCNNSVLLGMHLVQSPTGDYVTVFKTCPPHLGFLVKVKYRQLHPCWLLNGSSNPPFPYMSNSLFSPLDLCEHKQWQQPVYCYSPSETALGSCCSGHDLQDLISENKKKAGTAGFLQPSLAWLHFFSSVSRSSSEDLLPAWLDRVFQVCRMQLQ